MSLSNPSQLLLRNEDLLQGNDILVVGCPDPVLFSNLQAINTQAKISSFQTNYAQHQAISANNPLIQCQFSEQYQASDKHDLVIVYFPKSKQEFLFLMAMLATVISKQACILFVGENKGGVKSAKKLTSDYALRCDKVDSARHCILYEMIANDHAPEFNLDDWWQSYDINIDNIELSVAALPGVFSSKELDVGTKLLLENLPAQLSGKVLDFGCGAGVIGSFIKSLYPKTSISMLDVNALAIASARKTLQLNNLEADVFASDGLSKVSGKYQAVLSNPPFHQGIKTNYQTTEQFLQDIKKYLNKSASVTIVANSFLKYAPIINEHIGQSKLLVNAKGFAIHHCIYKGK